MIQETIKFLLVDDTPENLVALEALLRRPGLELLNARSGAEALELLLVHDVALAFLDVQMPEMNGFELAELMRGAERTKHVPIIFLTAGTRDPQRMFEGYDAGAVDFLFKPIDAHILKSKADVFYQLARQKIDLANNLRLNEMFVGILGHDLRNPLGSLVTGAQLLARQATTDEGHLRTVRRMLSSSSRMRDMVDQMQTTWRARGWAAASASSAHAGPSTSVRARRERIVDELQAASRRIARVSVVAHGDCRTARRRDAAHALAFSEPGLERHPPRSARHARHRDGRRHGLGRHGRRPQRRLDSPRHPAADLRPLSRRAVLAITSRGLGLGLYISQQIASAHGGAISVESTPAAGTSFTVRVPRVATIERTLSDSARRLLVVDDDEDIRESLREAFEEAGYEARTAADGHEALLMLVGTAPPRA